jgi:hypothetical protein
METKIEILRLIRDYNQGKMVGIPIIDRIMTQKGLFGKKLKILIDSYVEENLLSWENSLSLKITEDGVEFLKNEHIDKM